MLCDQKLTVLVVI